MKLIKLKPDTDLIGFDCGDEDLNNFLVEDAKGFLDKRIATSYILEDNDSIVAFFCLLNDKISRQDVTNGKGLRKDFRKASVLAAIRQLKLVDSLFLQNIKVVKSALT